MEWRWDEQSTGVVDGWQVSRLRAARQLDAGGEHSTAGSSPHIQHQPRTYCHVRALLLSDAPHNGGGAIVAHAYQALRQAVACVQAARLLGGGAVGFEGGDG